ncbi:hypothetical protein V1L52_06985 [Treponema sp. HNW]|uniref:fibronectin type III domain-containing protein n=1 Tax=Treponema sp. HNW TaxID=3116654 RepID=UPI003D0FB360
MVRIKLPVVVPFIFMLSVFTACKPILLPAPNTDISSQNTAAAAPSQLTATHGLKRKIVLTWEKNPEAKYYCIYGASSAQGPFIQINETRGNTPKIDLRVNAGTDNYYYVNSVLYDGTRSENSEIVRGTSLAKPIISSVEPVAEFPDEALSVHWWMNNADAKSYINNVRYTVICYNKDKVEATRIIDGSAIHNTKTVFENLKPHTNYSFTVEAYTTDFQNDTEKSDKLDSETARRLRPNPPENTRISQGDKTNSIEISFTLPDFVDVAQGNKIFKSHPIYFKIYRKQKGTNDNFVLIKDKLRPKPASPYADTDNPTYDELYTAYKPGEILQWVDDGNGSENIDADNTKDVERGVQYTYKIQSFADGVNREISSDLSFVSADGWARAKPLLSLQSADYVLNSDSNPTAFVQTKINLLLNWESFGKENDYSFILSEKRYKFDTDNGGIPDTTGFPPLLQKFNSIADFNSFVRIIDIPENDADVRGYYAYKLYFVPANYDTASGVPDSPIEELSLVKRIFVVRTYDIPRKEDFDFKVKSGFKNKIRLSWKYNESYTYNLIYYPAGQSETPTAIQNLNSVITSSTPNNSVVTYDHTVPSGTVYEYILKVKKGIEVDSDPLIGKTLGTPEPFFNNTAPEYDSIRVLWKEVQETDSYVLEFKSGDSSVIDNGSGIAVPNLKITKTADGSSYTSDTAAAEINYDADKKLISCTLKKPIGYNDAVKSGKPIKVKVKAKNGATTDETENETEVRTLGPALTAVEASDASYNDKIIVVWTPVQGAAGYIVKRTTQTSFNDSTPVHHQYLVKADDLSVTVDSQDVSDRIFVKSESRKIRLSDKAFAAPEENPSSWQKYQEKISWGAKHTYAVFPIKNMNDEFDPETNTLTNMTYTDVNTVSESGSALGYGRVTASKAEYPRKVEITWTKPYLGIREGLVPVLWKKESGADAQWQKTDISLDASGDKFVYVPKDAAGERFKAFEFIVSYKESETKPLASYISEIQKDKDSNNETLHKGYVFSIEFKAENQSSGGTLGFNELLRWKPYDKTERSRAPESDYKVFIKNADYGSDWQEIAVINKDTGAVSWTAEKADWAVNREQQGNAIIVKPRMTSDAHSGLLQVLRDYRHYAKIETTRTNTAGEVITASFADNDEEVYAYRQITDKELALMTTMALAHGIKTSMNKSPLGWEVSTTLNDVNPKVKSDGWAYNWTFTYDNYTPFLLSVTGVLQAATERSHTYPTHYGTGWQYIFPKWHLKGYNNTLTVTGPSDAPIQIKNAYSGILTISALAQNGDGKLTLTRGGTESAHLGNISPLVFENHSGYPSYNDWTVTEGWK